MYIKMCIHCIHAVMTLTYNALTCQHMWRKTVLFVLIKSQTEEEDLLWYTIFQLIYFLYSLTFSWYPVIVNESPWLWFVLATVSNSYVLTTNNYCKQIWLISNKHRYLEFSLIGALWIFLPQQIIYFVFMLSYYWWIRVLGVYDYDFISWYFYYKEYTAHRVYIFQFDYFITLK